MSDFMQGYGEKEARRGRWILRTALTVLTVGILGTVGYFYFRTWSEERIYGRFQEALAKKDYAAGYRMWCPMEKPCSRYYPMEKFMEDWGPSSPYANLESASVEHVDYCGSGVLFDLSYKDAEPIALWVERSTGIISFAPDQRCRGIRQFQVGPLLRRIFGGSKG